jgi:hypothetical protein
VRTVLQPSLEVESIFIIGFFPLKVALSKFWHVVDGLFMWAALHQLFSLTEYH